MPELNDEIYVRELFAELYGVRLAKVPESTEKTFDFELLSDAGRVAALEVKRFGAVPLTPQNGWRETPGGMLTRPDNAPSRVGDAIHAAYKQLATAKDPKVLVFVNDSHGLDALDLTEALSGYLVYGDSVTGRYKNPSGMKVAEGKIRDEKWAIDLYIWINRYDGRTVWRVDGKPLEPHAQRGPFFTATSHVGHDLAVRHFRMPPVPEPVVDPDADVPTLGEMLLRQAGVRRS